MSRIFTTSVASVHPHDLAKVEKTGRTRAELDQVIRRLTGHLGKLADELAKGRPMDKVSRS